MIHPSMGNRPQGNLAIPCIIVFFSGFCIMVLELVASRLVAGYIGMSLYTWTSVIGVILAGISLGNYIGGRLADRYESKRLVASLFAVSCLASLSILGLTHWTGTATANWIGSEQWWTARVLFVVFGSFLIPGAALGTISPGIAKWALDYGYATGPTVGTIYAWNTIGSIVGTFVTGFLFMYWFEVTTIVYLVSAALAAAALLFIPAILRYPGSVQRSAIPLSEVKRGGLLLPIALVFVSGFVVMAVELVASRLVAGHIGQSLFTWTSVIGVILAGISLGNYIGGNFADSFQSRPLVAGLFLISSICCLIILPTQYVVDNADEAWMGATPWWLRVLSVVFAAYFLPATALGTISPAVAKWALDQGYATGRTVGTVYAWNVIGSICGTFATGFVLISTFYVSRILAFSSLLLALIAILFAFLAGYWLQRIVAVVWLGVCAAVSLLVLLPANRFENAVLTLWPVKIESLDTEEYTFLSNAIERFSTNLLDAPIEDPVLAEEIEKLHDFARSVREKFVPSTSEESKPVDETLNADLHQLRRWSEAVEAELERQYVEGSLANSIRSMRNRLYDIFGPPERDRLRRVAKWVSRSDEINFWDQYFFRNDLEFYDESNYFTIQVSEDTVESNLLDDYEVDDEGNRVFDADGRPIKRKHDVRQLVLDALIHGYVDLSDFSYLHYEYEHIYATVSHRLLKMHKERGEDLRVLFLGGGSYTFPRYLTYYYPDIHCDVAEIDARVTQAVMESLGLNQACGKTFLIVDDPVTQMSVSLSATPGLGAVLSDALRLSKPTPTQRFKAYWEKLELAGARVWDSAKFDENDVDYVLDIRTNANGSTPILDRATELQIPVLNDAQLRELLHTTSHPNVVTHIGDARQYIMRNTNHGKYDVIYGDAFNDFSVPAHLTTLEFNRDMARLLKPDGMFMANVIDIWGVSKFMGAYINTLEQVFKYVYCLQTDEGEPGDSRSTFVLICSQEPVELHDLGERAEDIKGLVGSPLEGALLVPVISGGKGGVGPAKVVEIQGDGERNQFPVGADATDVIVEIKHAIPDSEYSLTGTEMIEFANPIPKDRTVEIRLTGVDENFSTGKRSEGDYALDPWNLEIEGTDLEYERKGSVVLTLNQVRPRSRISLTRTAGETIRLTGDGNTRVYPLPTGTLKLTQEWSPSIDEVSLKDGQVVFTQPLSGNHSARIHVWTAKDVILTDNYCPVDNMLAEVAATRAD